jgi:ATP-dependent Clp protease ATP-binding subunit ClpB
VSNEAKDWLAQIGYDVTYGARPLKRVIQKYMVNPLSQELLAGNFVEGDTIKVGVAERVGLVFSK